ncbi:MAG: 50S ribosomal protein L18e [Candidatus Pacearchaeota archaeon]|jgi:large subunit ribosomal protein L18e
MNKTKIERKLKKKSNPEIVETIITGKKNEKWLEVANLVSMPKRKMGSINLSDIEKQSKDNETIIVPTKVLGNGEVKKKIKIAALGFSAEAKEKLKKEKIEMVTILEEIKKNPEAKNIHIVKSRIYE